jgi:hypothetical protein
MSSPSFLIWCTSPEQTRGHELERWLQKETSRFGPEMRMYRAPCDASPARPGQAHEQVWFLTVRSEDAVDLTQVDAFLAEMRLLGLSPKVFHPGRSRARLAHA